ncbi:MAG: ROK family protein [Firmicutes bacterium]|nr:ROK family protein [Bacillota bacterium]
MKRGSFELMKKINQQVILKLIYTEKAISRAEIAEITGLSPATVTNITKGILGLGLIKETIHGESRGGRKPVLLEINPSGAYFIGLEWGIAELRGVLMDLNKKVVAYSEKRINSYQLDNFIELSANIIEEFYEHSIEKEKLCGLGVGVHGIVDPMRGYSLFAPHFKWRDIPLKARLEEEFALPVLIDNDVRAMALAEKWNGRDNFLFINTGSGIGAAIVMDGKLHYGRDYSAGEFGHMTLDKKGPLCSCGKRGCVEAFVSTDRLVYNYNEELNEELSHHTLQTEWSKLLNDARSGIEKAVFLLEDAVEYLGLGLANLVNLLNPEEILLAGDFIEGADLLLPLLKKKIKNNTLNIPGSKLQIEVSAFGEWVGAIGGATMVLEQLFNFQEEV